MLQIGVTTSCRAYIARKEDNGEQVDEYLKVSVNANEPTCVMIVRAIHCHSVLLTPDLFLYIISLQTLCLRHDLISP